MGLTFKLEKDGDKWHAFCPELKGCHTFGATKQEALVNLKNAVLLYLEDEIENQSMKAIMETNDEKFTNA
jgi:predicted RNase H-like HicB family nuclease